MIPWRLDQDYDVPLFHVDEPPPAPGPVTVDPGVRRTCPTCRHRTIVRAGQFIVHLRPTHGGLSIQCSGSGRPADAAR